MAVVPNHTVVVLREQGVAGVMFHRAAGVAAAVVLGRMAVVVVHREQVVVVAHHMLGVEVMVPSVVRTVVGEHRTAQMAAVEHHMVLVALRRIPAVDNRIVDSIVGTVDYILVAVVDRPVGSLVAVIRVQNLMVSLY